MATFTILEPMSTGDVIDRAVRIYRRNFSALIRIASVPCLTGYLASLMFWFGYTKLFSEVAITGSTEPPAFAIVSILVGGAGYLVWVMVLLATFAGLSRIVGDHVMLDEPITVRRFLSAVRERLGNVLVMALLFFAILFAIYILFSMVVFALVMIVALIVGLTAAAGLPPWAMGVLVGLAVIIAVAAGIIAMLFVVARVIFLPQAVMIEGQPPGQALGRAVKLGAGNWYRVGAIILFAYFVELSLLAALTLPVMATLYLAGVMDAEFIVSPAWNVFYAAFSQIANLLTLPIWIVSFTLLYFDSRVRKEAYDIELLAREVSPGFIWQPVVQAAPFGYQMPFGYPVPNPMTGMAGRTYIQTSPLGLAGWAPNRVPAPPPPPPQGPPFVQPPQPWAPQSQQFPPPAQPMTWPVPGSLPQPPTGFPERTAAERRDHADWNEAGSERSLHPGSGSQPAWCTNCGAALIPGARFCMRCGTEA